MTADEFARKARETCSPGHEWKNPGGGTSRVLRYTSDGQDLVYMRGKSTIYVSLHDLWSSFQPYLGKRLTSTDLKRDIPSVFSSKSNGHSCNCTTLFYILDRLGLTRRLGGRGVRGDPFYVDLKRAPGGEAE